MKINKKLELGILAVDFLKNRPLPTQLSELAPKLGTTTNFLSHVMRDLKVAGLVVGKRGSSGGYTLSKDTTITAYMIAKAVGRDFGILSFDQESALNRLNGAVIKAFMDITIS